MGGCSASRFSGEEGYEIAVPTRYGEALFRDLVARAETMGGGPYGMEALNVLRIEKGFITHAEIHGRVTAHDIGMEKMVSRQEGLHRQGGGDAAGDVGAGARAAGGPEGRRADQRRGASFRAGGGSAPRDGSGLCHQSSAGRRRSGPGWGWGS